MDTPHDLVPAGRVAAPYGVRGWVRVVSETEPPEKILDYRPWYLQDAGGHWQRWQPLEGRPHGKSLVARLEGCSDRDEAAALAGNTIGISRSAFDVLDDDEFYWADLVGLEVETTQGVALGRIERLIETGANDVLVVRGERERLIPYLPGDAVVEIDLVAGRMTVAWDPEF